MIDYAKIGQEIGELVKTKQEAYGDSFSKAGAVMLALYPNGIPAEKMNDALTIVRIVDKLFRIATKKDALGESPYRDIAGYALLAVGRDEKKLFHTDPCTWGDCPICHTVGITH